MLNSKNVHIIGIGGIGTSAVAKWFLHQGAVVTGSDMTETDITRELEARGIKIIIGHSAKNLPTECDLVIYSGAVPETNPERELAKEREIKELRYSQFLGEFAKVKKTIAISGTNGKSTTTAMIATIMIEAGMDPTVILGTKVPGWEDGNLRVGSGEWLIVEACEYMGHMLDISPNAMVITNIEEDHLDYYRDIDHIRETFQEWVKCKHMCAQVVLNERDEESNKLKAKFISYFDYSNRKVKDGVQYFNVATVPVTLYIPGEFNAANAAAAMTLVHIIGVPDDVATRALENFMGTWRRFEYVGKYKGAEVYSDYAHHPTAIKGAISAMKEFYPNKRIVAVFEPHQHSRTAELFDGFVESFKEADISIIGKIYGVKGRTEEVSVTSKDMADKIRVRCIDKKSIYAEDYSKIKSLLEENVTSDDIVLIMGAGTIDSVARDITKEKK